MWTRMSVGTLAEAEMDPDKYDKADANVSEADRRKIKNIDQPKGINRKWLVPIFYVCPAKLDYTCRCKSSHGNRQ